MKGPDPRDYIRDRWVFAALSTCVLLVITCTVAVCMWLSRS